MKRFAAVLIGLSVLILASSCGINYEAKGDRAYMNAKKATSDEQRRLQKEAYIYYQEAIKANPKRVTAKLRERFAEMCLLRANMVLNEGSSELDAIKLFIEDLDKIWSPDISAPIKRSYATFLAQIADSNLARGHIMNALARIDKATQVSDDPSPFTQKHQDIVKTVISNSIKLAQQEFDGAVKAKDSVESVKAEYHVNVALLFDSTNAEALKLLGDIRKFNTGMYSAYRSVIENIPDTTIFRRITKSWIFMRIPAILNTKGSMVLEVMMYNYSANPQRLKPEFFFLVDDAGNKVQASPGSKIETEILDQEKETRFKLSFAKPAGQVKKLVYQNETYISEKFFY